MCEVGDSFELKGAGEGEGEDDSEEDSEEAPEVLGLAVKNCGAASKPIFVSVGHRIDLDTAKRVVIKCSM